MMKVKLTYLIIVFAFGLVSAHAAETIEKDKKETDLKYGLHPFSTSIGISKSIKQKQFQNQTDTNSTSHEKSSRISHVQNATVNASVIQEGETVLSLIEVFRFVINESCTQILAQHNQGGLFKILFQLIISPNAP